MLLFSLLRVTYVLEAAERTTQVRNCTVLGKPYTEEPLLHIARFPAEWITSEPVIRELFGDLMPCTLLTQRRRYFEGRGDSCRLWPPS